MWDKKIFSLNILGVIIFGSVRLLLKTNNQTEFKKKTKTKPKPIQTDRFRFNSVFRTKTGLTRFFCLAQVFFRLGFGSVRFFRFQAYKTEIESNRLVFSKF